MTKAQRALDLALNGALRDGQIDSNVATGLRVIANEIDENSKETHRRLMSIDDKFTSLEDKFTAMSRNIMIALSGVAIPVVTAAVIAALRVS
jgi:hypothetical protein